MLEDLNAGLYALLCDEASDGDHGKTAVVQLLGLHDLEVGGVGGLQVQGVEVQGAWAVVILEGVEASANGGLPAECHTVCLGDTDSEDKGLPEDGTTGLDLLELQDRGACKSLKFCQLSGLPNFFFKELSKRWNHHFTSAEPFVTYASVTYC